MSKIAHSFHGPSVTCPRENVCRAEVFRLHIPRKVITNPGLKRSASEDLVPEQEDEVEKDGSEM